MAGYIRQSSFSDGDTITAALFNNEFNQALNAFSNTGGHKHDGTAAEGPVIGLIGDAGETAPNNKVLIDTTNNFIEFYVQVSSSPVQQLYIADGAIIPVTNNDIDLGTSSLEFKDAYFDGTVTSDAFAGPLTGDVTGNVSGTAATVTTAAQSNITSLGTLTTLTVDNVIINGTTIGHTSDTDLLTLTSGVLTVAGELDAISLDISGDADIDGTLEADAITIGGVTLAETISDTVGAMVSSNTETNITVTYDDSDNTLDFVIGTLNQDTTGLAATATALATARTIHGVSFDGTANIDLSEVISDTVGAMVSSNTETNITVAYQDADNTLDFTIGTLNQDTTGNAGTATALATARTIGGTSFDGTANIAVGLAATATALATARTIHGVSFDGTANIDLSEVISDTVGAMVSSNTESGITVAYQDADNTLDFTIGTLNQNTTGSAATLTTARTIGGVSFNGSANIDLPGVNSAGNQNTTGTAATVTTAAQPNITSLGTLTTLTVDNVIINGTNIGHTSDTDSIAIASNGVVTFSQIPVLPANSIDSDYYVDGSIDTAHIADSQITVAKMAANSIDSDQYVDGSIDTAHYADNSITGAELADNIDIAGTFDVTGATTLDSTLVVAGIATASTSAKITQVAITSSSNAVAWDAAAAANAYHVTTENTTFSAPSNAVEGAIISVELAQGGTPRTIAWNTVFEFAASTAPTVTATANKTDIFSFRYNGSVWQEIGRVQNMAQT